MIREHDLSPVGKTGAQLVEAIWAAYRAEQRGMHSFVADLAKHDDPVVREEAISLLLVKWADVRYRPLALAVLGGDPDFGVRVRAATGLASVSIPATHDEDVECLLRALRDPTEEIDVRRAAYEALLHIGGRLDFPSHMKSFEPERDVDWEWLLTL